MNYELFYLIGASHESELGKIKKDVEKIITENEGVFEELEIMEKKRLAYKVKHETIGFYVARRFEIDPEKITEINKKLNLYPGVLRFMISKSSELPELKVKDRDLDREKKYQPVSAEKTREAKESPEARPENLPVPEKEEKEKLPKEPDKSDEDIDKKLEEILNL